MAAVVRLEDLAGIGRKMPVTMAAFTIAGFGLVGTPGTSGFISKWYLAVGALDKGWWILVLPDRRKLDDRACLRRPRPGSRLAARTFAASRRSQVTHRFPCCFRSSFWRFATVYFGFDTEWTAGVAGTAAKSLLGGLR